MFAELPRLLERTGMGEHGSITALYTVLAEDDSGSDPIAEEVRGILDGHIILSREIAARNQYPAIDVLGSLSRIMPQVATREHVGAAGRLRQLLAKHREIETLLQLGEYQAGSDPAADEAVAKIDRIRAFLNQRTDEYSPPDATLAGALDRTGSPQLGQDAGAFLGKQTGVALTDDIERVCAEADYLIDFTRPEGTLAHLDAALRHDVKLVIGTTGFSEPQKAQLRAAGGKIALVFSANMSVGVNVTMKLLEFAAKQFAQGYDIEIIEAHHRHKVDAPSGTALMMGETIAAATGRTLDDCAVYGRHGVTGERDPSTIGFSAIRGGDIVGDHTVLFAGIGERIEITHKSASRVSYAQGALRAARFLAGHQAGFFDMQDVLGLR